MKNPWEAVPLAAYEAHMQAPHVGQLQALSAVMKCQLSRCAPQTVCVLGVAGGNGLEHIDPVHTRRVYGIDVSEEYLDACGRRFGASLGDKLALIWMDLKDEASRLPQADAVIADLVIEYIGIEAFARLVDAARPAAVCCAVQASCGAAFVSETHCAQALQCIGDIHEDIEPCALEDAMARIGYRISFREECPLPGGKRLVCVDFTR